MRMRNEVIYKTKNYSQFMHNEMNRDISRTKVKRLMQSMQACGGFRHSDAIHVKRYGKKYKIERGHHRFVAAKELGIPFYYTIDESLFDIIEDEHIRKDWTAKEISVGLANKGNPDYVYLLDFMRENDMSISTSGMLLMGLKTKSGAVTQVLRDGLFRVTEEGVEHAKKVLPILNVCKECGVKFASHRSFVQAISTLCSIKEFDVDRFIQRVRVDCARMMSRNSTMEFIEEIESLYNFRNKGYISLKEKVIEAGWYKRSK